MFDLLHQRFRRSPFLARKQHLARALDRGIPDLNDTVFGDRRQKPDLDRIPYVHVIRESTGQVERVDFFRSDPKVPHQDELAAEIRRFGLGQVAGVFAGQ